jgi:mRNA interferase RelE/StbE
MSYKVLISKVAAKEIKVLSHVDAIRVFDKIKSLAADPRPPGCKKLKRSDGLLWRIRSGDYRILYSITDVIKVVEVIRVGNRDDVYRNL